MKWLLAVLFACHAPSAVPALGPPPTCPAAGETAVDCPWAAVARGATTDAHAAIVTVGAFQFQVGWLPAGALRRIGQFFPKSGAGVENIPRNVMQAIAKIIGP